MLCPACGQATRADLPACTVCGVSLPQQSPAPEAATAAFAATSFDGLTLGPTTAGDAPTIAPAPVSTVEDAAPTLIPGMPTVVPGSAAVEGSEEGPLKPGQAFGARYHIIRMLGIGGMGAVYQAWDAELGVAVALKVIRPEIAGDPRAAADVERRFKRELLLARQVTHKNVVRIHDLGEIDGIKYITMEYVNGTDLGTLLKRDGPMPVEKLLPIARSLVSGLVAAHAAGVVHRDLKPANIIINTDGDALIMDFGIARSAGGPASAAVATPSAQAGTAVRAPTRVVEATMLGVIVGTIEYMAPEQAKGLAVDQRADIYALGLIFYDALAGRGRIGSAESAVAELQARMAQAPPPLKTLLPSLPDPVDGLIARCLDPDPDKRYPTTQELADELERIDEHGNAIRARRVVGLPLMAATILLALALVGGAWWYAQTLAPEIPPEPVAVVIADFDNRTGEDAFDGTLEPMLRRALEGAGFISAYDRNGIVRTLGVRAPDRLDENAARELAVQQGLGVVLAGAVERDGSGYGVSVRAVRTVTGEVIATSRVRAANRDDVLPASTRLATTVRRALGDDEISESDQIFAMASLSATSLDVVRHYADAQEAASNNRFEDARQSALKAVELDPNFGVGYQLLAYTSRNVGRVQDADTYIKQAIQHVDGMTERERLSTRGMFFRLTGDYKACVEEYGRLIARYQADVVGHNQRALCSSQLRDMAGAVEDMRTVVKLLPNRTLFRANLALYSNYAGDFSGAEREATAIEEPDAYATLALALAQLGQGRYDEAQATYERLATIDTLGASMAASGLGDLAFVRGRFSEAMKRLETGAAADLAAGVPARAAPKLALLAHVHLAAGQTRAAVTAADRALEHGAGVTVRFLAGRAYVHAGEPARARPLIEGLASELQAEPQAYAKVLEGEVALASGNARDAVRLLTEANALLNTWIGTFVLGQAYLEAGAYTQADAQFDSALKRRGESLAIFLDEEPTHGLFPAVFYYQGRAREAMKTAAFAESYRQYLALREAANEDPLLADLRRRGAN